MRFSADGKRSSRSVKPVTLWNSGHPQPNAGAGDFTGRPFRRDKHFRDVGNVAGTGVGVRRGINRFDSHLRDVASGRLLGTLNGPRPPIRNVVLGPKGVNSLFASKPKPGAHLRLRDRWRSQTGRASRFCQRAGVFAGRSAAGHRERQRDDPPVGRGLRARDGDVARAHAGNHQMWHYSPDGRTLASLSKTESLKLWRTAHLARGFLGRTSSRRNVRAFLTRRPASGGGRRRTDGAPA